jgi:hypothetical protein
MKVARLFAVAAAVVLFSTGAYADNRLLPTDMMDPGRFFMEFGYALSSGSGELDMGGIDVDAKFEEHRIPFGLGFGLSPGVDVDIHSGYVATGTGRMEADTILGHVEMKTYVEGIEDTSLSLRFRLADERRNGANVIFALTGVFPSGYRKDGEPEIELNGTKVNDLKRDYPGEGVVSYGGGFAISGTSGSIEPYMVGTYIFGGKRKRHDIKEHYADEAALTLGMQVHTSPHAAIDFSLSVMHNSPETVESDRSRSRESGFLMGGASLRMFFELAPDTTFYIGIMYVMIEGHQVDRDSGDKLKDASSIIPSIGFHILF